jgi:putative DNA primase/helicase
VTFEAVCQRLDAHRVGSSMMAKCPAHDDHDPSLSIDEGSDGKVLVKCWGGCQLEDILAAAQLTIQDLFPNPREPSANGEKPRAKLFDWETCTASLSDKAMEAMAKSRGFSKEFVAELKQLRMIGVWGTHFAVPVVDAGRVVGVQYRIKEDHSWRYHPEGIKSQVWVIGILDPKEHIEVFESNFDGMSFMERSGYRDNIIITRGTANAKAAAALVPKGAVARLYTQNDSPGEQWEADFCSVAECTVKRVRIPIVFKDFNQWMQDGEPTPDEVIRAIAEAEIIKQGEQTWTQALFQSIVTSAELPTLTLTPRRKLMDEWFREGDLGYIFGFRGVAKTWFALGLSTALATGGRFGEWVAHEPIPIAYLDSEMPAEDICQRLTGMGVSDNFHLLNHELLFERTGKVININNVSIQKSITEYCVLSSIKLLIIDNLSTAASGMKENEADSWEQMNRWLLELRRERIAVVIIHHAGRSGQMRGTSKREDAAFWVIQLDDAKKDSDDRNGARFITRFTKASRNTQQDVPSFEWHFVTDPVTKLVSIGCKVSEGLVVFRAVIESGVTKPSEIAKAMGLQDYQVSRMAKKARDQGWLTKISRGEYAIVEDL